MKRSTITIACIAASTLSACIFTPSQVGHGNLKGPILFSGFVPQKGLPIVISCYPDSHVLVQEVGRGMPSQTPITDKFGKVMYSFSITTTLHPDCIFPTLLEGPLRRGAEQVSYSVPMASLNLAQEITRANGTKYKSYANLIAGNDVLKKCAMKHFTATQSFATVINNCSKHVDFSSNGNITMWGDWTYWGDAR